MERAKRDVGFVIRCGGFLVGCGLGQEHPGTHRVQKASALLLLLLEAGCYEAKLQTFSDAEVGPSKKLR